MLVQMFADVNFKKIRRKLKQGDDSDGRKIKMSNNQSFTFDGMRGKNQKQSTTHLGKMFYFIQVYIQSIALRRPNRCARIVEYCN